MFFPDAPISINSISFRATLQGQAGQTNNRSENLIEFNDGTLEPFIFDGRKEISSKINIPSIQHDTFIILKDYLQDNSGETIEITLEDGDQLFGPRFDFTTLFAQVTEVSPTGEQDFSVNNELFDMGIGFVFVGITSDAVFNTSSKIDWLITVNTNLRGADYIVNTAVERLALTPVEGEWCYQIDELTFFRANSPSSWAAKDTINNTQKVILNDPTINFSNGKFQWSLFTEHAITDDPESQNNASFKPGFISYKSLNLSEKKIDIRKGGGFEKLPGFNFSVVNVNRLHETFTNNEISLFGSVGTVDYFHIDAPSNTRYVSGLLENSNFGNMNFTLNFKPQPLVITKKYPDETLSDLKYEILDPEEAGNTALQTFGRWPMGELQELSFKTNNDEFTLGNLYSSLFELPDTVVINTVTYQRITFNVAFSEFSQTGFPNLPLDSVTTQPLFFISLKTSDSWQINVNGGVLGYTDNSGNLAFFLEEKTFKVEQVFGGLVRADSVDDQTGSFLIISGPDVEVGQAISITLPSAGSPAVTGAIVASYDVDFKTIRFTEPLAIAIEDTSVLTSDKLIDVGDVFSLFKQGIAFAADSELIEGFEVDNGDDSITINIFTKDSNGDVIELNSDKFKVLDNGKNNIIFLPAENLNINGDGSFNNETITPPSNRVSLEALAGTNFYTSRVGPLWNLETKDFELTIEIPSSSSSFTLSRFVTESNEIDLLLISGSDDSTDKYIGKNIATGAGGSYQDKWEAFTPSGKDFPTTIFQSYTFSNNSQEPAGNGNEALAAYGVGYKKVSKPNSNYSSGVFQVNYGSSLSNNLPTIEASTLMTSWAYIVSDEAKLALRDKENVSMLVSFSVLYGDSTVFGDLDKSIGKNIGDWQISDSFNITSDSFTTVDIEGVGAENFASTTLLITDLANDFVVFCSTQNYNSINSTIDLKSLDSNPFPGISIKKGYKLRVITSSNFGSTDGILKISGYDSLTNTKVELSRIECFNANTGYNTTTENQYIFMNLPGALGGRDEDFEDSANKDEDGKTIPVKVGDVGFAQGFHFRGSNLLEIPNSIFENGGVLFNRFSSIIFEFYNKNKISTGFDNSNMSFFSQNVLYGNEFLIGQGVVNGTEIDDSVGDGNSLYFTYNEEVDLINRPAFVKVNGKIENGSMVENQLEIIKSVTTQAGITPDATQTDYLSSEDINQGNKYLLRKQYSTAKNATDVIKDICFQTHYAATLDENDNIKLVSLDEENKSSRMEFNDSNIVKSSVQITRHRKSNEIFQRFIFSYNWNPLKKKNDRQITIGLDDNGDLFTDGLTPEEKASYAPILEDSLKVSRSFYQLNGVDNTLKVDLNMFYDLPDFGEIKSDPALFPFDPRQSLIHNIPKFIRHNIFNAWTLRFSVKEDLFTFKDSFTRLKLGEKVDFQTYFQTNNVVISGLITGITPSPYDGIWGVEIYVTKPVDATLGINDTVWDGLTDSIDTSLFTIRKQDEWDFKDPIQVGTYPDGGEGPITLSDYQFDDDTFADYDEDLF